MKRVGKVFSAASGVFGVVPGLAILIANMGVPPNVSKFLFAGTIESLGVLTLLLLWVNKQRIVLFSNRTINRNCFWAVGIFLVSFMGYFVLYESLVEEVPNSKPLFFPIWSNGELKEGLASHSSRAELIREWGRDDVFKVISESSEFPLLVSTLILLMIYLLPFLSLTYAFGILGIKKDAMGKDKPADAGA